jgi:excisionase family DNA binding protein
LRLRWQKNGISPKDTPETAEETGSSLLTSGINPDITRFDLKFSPREDKPTTHRGKATFMAADSREVMNIRQASQYLGVSPDTLYKYVTEERIPAFKLGNRWKFKKTILDQWMEQKSTMNMSSAKKKPKAAKAAGGR